jgi:hypothetical protein
MLAVGKTALQVVNLGDDAKSISAIFELNFYHYQRGEIVSVYRSDGTRRTIAQIRHVCPEFIDLDLENGLEKQISAMKIPKSIGKLIGPYCLRSELAVFLTGSDSLAIPNQKGRSNLFPLSLGQDCTQLQKSNGFTSECFYLGELVSFSPEPGGLKVCGVVISISQKSLTINSDRRKGAIEIAAAMAYKLHGLFYLLDTAGSLPCITVGKSVFQGIQLGQDTRNIPRSNNYSAGQFYYGEPVSVKFMNGMRIAHKVVSVNPNGSLSLVCDEALHANLTIVEESVCTYVSKLHGSFYVTNANSDQVLIEVHSAFIKIGHTIANSLVLGNHGPLLPVIEATPVLHIGEPVSVLLEDSSREVGLVKAIASDISITVYMSGGREVHFPWAYRDLHIRTLAGCYYVLDSPSADNFQHQALPLPPASSSYVSLQFTCMNSCLRFSTVYLSNWRIQNENAPASTSSIYQTGNSFVL